MPALIASNVIGVTHSYLWNRYWTFEPGKNKLKEFARFNSVYLASFFINLAALPFLVEVMHLDPRIGQLIMLPLTTMISFLGHRFWSFNGR